MSDRAPRLCDLERGQIRPACRPTVGSSPGQGPAPLRPFATRRGFGGPMCGWRGRHGGLCRHTETTVGGMPPPRRAYRPCSHGTTSLPGEGVGLPCRRAHPHCDLCHSWPAGAGGAGGRWRGWRSAGWGWRAGVGAAGWRVARRGRGAGVAGCRAGEVGWWGRGRVDHFLEGAALWVGRVSSRECGAGWRGRGRPPGLAARVGRGLGRQPLGPGVQAGSRRRSPAGLRRTGVSPGPTGPPPGAGGAATACAPPAPARWRRE